MTQIQISKHKFDLEERTYNFAKSVRDFCKKFPSTISNVEYFKQIIRSSSSVAANYIEANESLSKKDFVMRVKICRKESKETRLWLNLIELNENNNLIKIKENLVQESTELIKIFTSIIDKSL